MAGRILLFFFLFILTFCVAAALLLREGLSIIKSDYLQRQQQIHQALSDELSSSYRTLDELIQKKSIQYKELHRFGSQWIQQQGDAAKLAGLQEILSEQAGFPVDIYLISDDLVIRNTTFAPDQGLNFNHDVFKDVRLYLQAAKESGKVLISQPTIELSSRKFKLYSYSALPGGGYFELGWVDPELNRFFREFTRTADFRSDVKIELYFENWGELLAKIGGPASSTEPKKMHALDVQLNSHQQDYRHFKQVISTQRPVQIERQQDDGLLTSYYGELYTIEMPVGLTMRVVAKITFDDSWFASLEQNLALFVTTLSAIAITFMAGLLGLIRFRLVNPIYALVKAMQRHQPIEFRSSSVVPELRYLGDNYDQLLATNRQQMEQLQELTTRDPLTGLYNRRHLKSTFNFESPRALRSGEKLGFAMVDVDFFKAYNDLYGHPAGDEALARIADLLQSHFRRPGDFVYRMGGEEFALLVTGTTPDSFTQQLDAMRAHLEEMGFEHKGNPITQVLTLSIGFCLIGGGSATLQEVIEMADRALYKAKRAGRNRVIADRDAEQASYQSRKKALQ